MSFKKNMNNILSFDEYSGYELEQVVYDQELNEAFKVRGFFNKWAARKVRNKLSDEIEMSKAIMEGIQNGLEALNENFDVIKEKIDNSDDAKEKGEKQKALDAIMKILEDSRKNTWDLNALIDEGEIDYTGFTANVGIASVAYFGILFSPFRASVMIHKGYNYFFGIIKNTVRKALVMLQLNFDQFENLIITKAFQSAGYLQAIEVGTQIADFYKDLEAEFVKNGGKNAEKLKLKLQAARQHADELRKNSKAIQQSESAYNCMDQYNNTYTKSLETLRQYSSEDVQKHLDSIKTSMSKLAGQDQDLQTFSELIIANAEEHAYKVSSSIYNKFAKMTEVFSLPNQKKLIDLIQAATKEQQDAAEKVSKDKDMKEAEKKAEEAEKEALEVFKEVDGTEIGDIDKETKKYDSSKIKADNWTYEKFQELDEKKKDVLERWLGIHPEVLDKCDITLQLAFDIPFENSSYIDSLVDYIEPCISMATNEAYIWNFDEFILEKVSSSIKSKSKKDDSTEEKINKKINKASDCDEFLTSLFIDKEKFDKTDLKRLDYAIEKVKNISSKKDWVEKLKKKRNEIEKELSSKGKKKYYLDFEELSDSNLKDLKNLYKNKNVAIVAFKVIGEKVLKDNTFVKNSEDLVNIIKKCLKSKKEDISPVTYNLLKDSLAKLKNARNNDYVSVENDEKKSEN